MGCSLGALTSATPSAAISAVVAVRADLSAGSCVGEYGVAGSAGIELRLADLGPAVGSTMPDTAGLGLGLVGSAGAVASGSRATTGTRFDDPRITPAVGTPTAGIALGALGSHPPQLGIELDAICSEEVDGLRQWSSDFPLTIRGVVMQKPPERLVAVGGVLHRVEDEGVPADVHQLTRADARVVDGGVHEHQGLVEDGIGQLLRELMLLHHPLGDPLASLLIQRGDCWVHWSLLLVGGYQLG